jgi:ubiquinone/menaquinone biosynthesis C-methylase UbiE
MMSMEVSGALHHFSIAPAELGLPPTHIRIERALDVGGYGRDFMHPRYAGAKELCAIDPDMRAVEFGQQHFPRVSTRHGYAENLPFPDAYFDVVTARVSLPYTDIPAALAQIARVTKRGGYLCVSLHDWSRHWRSIMEVRSVKRAIDMAYITLASWCYVLTDHVPTRPWNGSRETYQITGKMRRALAAIGFEQIAYQKVGDRCLMTAIRS